MVFSRQNIVYTATLECSEVRRSKGLCIGVRWISGSLCTGHFVKVSRVSSETSSLGVPSIVTLTLNATPGIALQSAAAKTSLIWCLRTARRWTREHPLHRDQKCSSRLLFDPFFAPPLQVPAVINCSSDPYCKT